VTDPNPDAIVAAALQEARGGRVEGALPGSPALVIDAPPGATDPPTTGEPTPTEPTTTTGPPTSSSPHATPSTATVTSPQSAVAPTSGGSLAAASIPSGTGVNTFLRAADGALWWRQLTQAAGWSAWQSFGGSITSNPSAAASAFGWTYVFARGADNAVWWQGYDGTRWTGWKTVGGTATSDVETYADTTGVYVFVRGPGNALFWGVISTSGWSGWLAAGGSLLSRAAVASDSSGVYAFVVGADSAVWVQRFVGTGSSGWTSLGGGTALPLAAAADSTGVSVYARGSSGALFRRRAVGGGYTPWESLGGLITSVPAAVGTGSSTHLFVRGLDNAEYWQQINNGTPGGWVSLGGNATSTAAASADPGGVTVFVRGADGQLWGQRNEGTWTGWNQIGGVPVDSDPFALAAPQINAAPLYTGFGYGFDACEAPPTSATGTWRLASPYTSIGVYIGGINRACSNAALNNSTWVNTVVSQGWRLIPIYVGLQAPCINFGSAQLSRDPPTAFFQGVDAGGDAANRALNAGLPYNSPIYFDMEGYDNSDAGCVAAVRSFVNGWVAELHALGFRAAMYSSLCSGIVDQATVYNTAGYNRLDAIWFAAWPYLNGDDAGYATYTPTLFGLTGCGAPLTDSMWTYHLRIRQYRASHNETYGSVTINIDTDAVDGPLAP
jgi:hypothetical protein